MTGEGLTIVVPAYEEAAGIRQTLEAIAAGVPSSVGGWEIVVVDDGSADGTGDVVRALGARDHRIRCAVHAENRGKGRAVRTGIGEARMPWILLLDADGQVGIEELDGVALDGGARDALVGYRVGRRESALRKLVTATYGALVRTALGLRVRDVNCPFKLLRREVLQSLPLRSDGFTIDAEILFRLATRGVAVDETEVAWHARARGASSIGPRAIPAVARELVRLWWERVGMRRRR